ncbi:hypothetical protein [Streptomyces sp. NL15-2K]|uniref:hypothetical protein n=1 Tax=Streptomyces sp. NL15-2K TaxID=376149 RepID=UPI000F5756F0|nr:MULTISPECIES: hypothetical protein [Actinomycetes]WKX07408.1 hypothetical protein Q4V64_07870 [Kutzneria buriramensis]
MTRASPVAICIDGLEAAVDERGSQRSISSATSPVQPDGDQGALSDATPVSSRTASRLILVTSGDIRKAARVVWVVKIKQVRAEGAPVPPKSKVDLYAAIRRDVRAGMSNRAVQRKYGVGFRTVKAALESVWPEPRKQLPPARRRRLTISAAISGRASLRTGRNEVAPPVPCCLDARRDFCRF